ncbi:glycine betaine ABC transporter substrate-binding protein [Aphanizomenon flos-aquae NRERC-008]|jgi:osmoprotectant transport system permease protein|uniref:ABC transporter permease subunit n=1 Tax=Aphanizomenon flos-aquae FACHB-1249 TaxID=2692889 RepID=A0ABR8IKQ0_APHFL|nr:MULTISPECIES: glycine betaine ABC transporter substrate-binding protein [Aphanizomenon]MBD2391087.1 ABC transporter permease subunit [Aphanizomenon flos-aquae FACHB-1171]MBD2556482.1 ABC transporter permease subunit [Aphanizomenon flos-aquae FACHB-1290]MBD2630163.1 ABC transporter permease subunit [Aphanizomenon sp. FACHB-1399]MBD2641322.1 ABC transporter permease subunit [Aphanizomenon sp. FACHB-1401]MBD2657798.1 ABC transporter permease subunit [Aphanizomenon flos-aquae FACHB-1265]
MFLFQYGSEIILHSGEHLILVVIAMTIAISIGLPVGIFITRQPQLAAPIMGLANTIQTIPSLAIFGFLISVPFLGGIGKVPAIVALTLYALLPIIRNTYIGINSINPAIKEAGIGMGMTDQQLLLKVEIPLALPVILAGVRVATVISVGIATIAAAIGGGGLGVFIFRGISTVNNELILAGAIPAALIALSADFGLGFLEKNLTKPTGNKSKLAIILGIITLIIAGLIAFNYQKAPETIIIGSKNFTEQVILGELLAQHIENHTKLKVDRRFNLGGTFIVHEAVKAGKIAGYVEYTGTSFTTILKEKPISNPQIVYEKVKEYYDQKLKLTVMKPLGFENTFAMIIRGEDAKKWQIKSLSEAGKYSPQMKAGFGYEFLEREDGYPGLSKTYNLKFANIKQMELGLMYQALKEKQLDFIAANSTDGLIPVLNLVILEDDKKYFPPYQAIPIFNQEILRKYPELTDTINQLGGKVSTTAIQKMNYQVDNQSQPVGKVVSEWLKSQKL